MSRREDRSSESKRHRSRFDREPSPKRSRRDGKPETERTPTEPELEKDRMDRDHRHHRRLQDSLPLEAGSKVVPASINKHSSDPSKVPLSRSYFQHDDRGSAGQNGRSSNRRTDSERGWWRDPKEQQKVATNKTVPSDAQQKDDKSKDSREGNVWRHDGYFEMEANQKPPPRKRPAFREQKVPADPENTNSTAKDPVMLKPRDHAADRGRRNERWNDSRPSDKSERTFAGGRELNKAQSWGGNFSSRDRYRGRDRFNGRQGEGQGQGQGQWHGYHPTGGHADKWKHDLYSEANKSPPPKNEDDHISKIEALLAS